MESWFSNSEYLSDLVENKTKKVKLTPNVNKRNRGKFITGVSFVLADHPKLKGTLMQIWKFHYMLEFI